MMPRAAPSGGEAMEDPRFQTRYGTPADNVLLAELGAETFADSFGSGNTPDNMRAYLTASFSPEKQARELSDPESRFLIVEQAGTAVGYAHLIFGRAPDLVGGRRAAELARFYARKDWIGKGMGAHLMKACLREAARAGCDRVWLGVWERNPRAIAFYVKWGFRRVGTQAFHLGDDVQNDWVMARSTAGSVTQDL